MIGMEDAEVFGIELPKVLDSPLADKKYPIKTHKLKIPLVDQKQENSITDLFFLNHDQWRMEKYYLIKDLRSIKTPEYYYTDNLKDETQINLKKKEHDKQVLNMMKDYIV